MEGGLTQNSLQTETSQQGLVNYSRLGLGAGRQLAETDFGHEGCQGFPSTEALASPTTAKSWAKFIAPTAGRSSARVCSSTAAAAWFLPCCIIRTARSECGSCLTYSCFLSLGKHMRTSWTQVTHGTSDHSNSSRQMVLTTWPVP